MQTITTSIKNTTSIRFTFALYALAFTIPLLFSSPQLITGTVINCLLFLATERLSKKEIFPLVILPSLGAIAHGVLFGPQTVFLYYFLPFIWISNYVLITIFSTLQKQSYGTRIILSAIVKYMILHFFAQLYLKNNIVPAVFVYSMGYIQLITALFGGLLSYSLNKTLTYERR